MPRFDQILKIPALQEAIDKEQVEKEINPFLDAMSQMESSGGQNLNHKRMVAGIHAGDTAQGQYGLMPNTVKELTYTKGDQRDPMIEQLRGLPIEDIMAEVKVNPELEKVYAEALARKLLTNAMGDEEKAAIGWRWGHNLREDQLEKKAKRKKAYINRFSKLFNTQPVEVAEDNINSLPET